MYSNTNDIPNFYNKIHTFFYKTRGFLADEDKNIIAQEIIEESNFGKLYRLQLVLSGIVSTLGLLINSVPVIIGAMLIAPILLPIKTIAFAITTGNKHLYKRGLMFIALSVFVGIGVSFLVSYLTPLHTLTSEILSRTSPTIIDLCIALASGVIAFLSLGFKKLSESVAGVAMATALIPPLCVVGIGFDVLNMEIVKGSFLLFVTNLFSIILIGIFVFSWFGFFPSDNKGQKRTLSNLGITIFTLLLLSIPLTNSMNSIVTDLSITNTITQVTSDFIKNIDTANKLEKITYQNLDQDKIRIDATINIPNTLLITQDNKDNLSKILASRIEKSVELTINIVSFSSVYIEQKVEPTKNDLIKSVIVSYLKNHTGVVLIEQKLTNYDSTQLVYLNLFAYNNLVDQDKIEFDIKQNIQNILGENTVTVVLWHKIGDNKNTSLIASGLIQKQNYVDIVNAFLLDNTSNTYLEGLDFLEFFGSGDHIELQLKLSSSLNKQILDTKISMLKSILEQTFNRVFIITVKTFMLSDVIVK